LNPTQTADQEPTDSVLLEQMLAGEPRVFEQLVARHRQVVWRVARRLMRDHSAADDVFQETFVALYRSAAGITAGGSLRSWLLAVTRRAALRSWRTRAGEPSHYEELEDVDLVSLGVAAGWGADPEASLQQAQRREVLQRALLKLTPAEREVLVLREFEGLTGAQTAAALGIPLAAMKTRLHRARLRVLAIARLEVTHGA